MNMHLDFVARSFSVTLPVQPNVPLVPAIGIALAKELSQKFPVPDIHISDERWEYKRPMVSEASPRGVVKIVVREDSIKIEHQHPATQLEPFENLVGQVLAAFASCFDQTYRPVFVGGLDVELAYVVDLSVDARKSMLEKLGLVDDEGGKMTCFGRPCHSVGLRLGFPPYQLSDDDDDTDEESASDDEPINEQLDEATPDEVDTPLTSDRTSGQLHESDPESEEDDVDNLTHAAFGGELWQANVSINTMDENPKKVVVRVSGTWPIPSLWKNIEPAVHHRLSIAVQFLKQKVSTFIEHFRRTGDEQE
jgi:hypothetical protein